MKNKKVAGRRAFYRNGLAPPKEGRDAPYPPQEGIIEAPHPPKAGIEAPHPPKAGKGDPQPPNAGNEAPNPPKPNGLKPTDRGTTGSTLTVAPAGLDNAVTPLALAMDPAGVDETSIPPIPELQGPKNCPEAIPLMAKNAVTATIDRARAYPATG